MKAIKWLSVTFGLGVVWYVTRAVVVQFLGILAFFVTAFEASVHELTKAAERIEEVAEKGPRPLPRRLAADRAYRRSEEAELLIDLREDVNVPS